jgi:hypothetical protein
MCGGCGGLKNQLNKMDTLPLNLIVFATTMGHGGEHTYKEALESLFSEIDRDVFVNRVLHLKVREGEEEKAMEIEDFCEKHKIRVIRTNGDLVYHATNHQNHSSEYFKDIFKSYSDLQLRKTKYSLWFEDDSPLFLKGTELIDAFRESIEFLEENPDQLCVTFNRSEDFKKPDGEYTTESGNIFTQTKNYTKYGPAFHFQPNINRTSEIFLAWKTMQAYLDQLGVYHCELLATRVLIEAFSNSDTPFSFFDPEKVYSKHLG